jgi:hypothetical protein
MVGTFKSNELVFDNSVFYKAGGVFRKRKYFIIQLHLLVIVLLLLVYTKV